MDRGWVCEWFVSHFLLLDFLGDAAQEKTHGRRRGLKNGTSLILAPRGLPPPHAIAATLAETIHCVADNILSVISKGNEGKGADETNTNTNGAAKAAEERHFRGIKHPPTMGARNSLMNPRPLYATRSNFVNQPE